MKNLKRIWILVLTAMVSSTLWAQPIHDLELEVSILEDGSAELTFMMTLTLSDSLSSFQIPAGYEEQEIVSATLDGDRITGATSISLDRSLPVFDLHFATSIIGDHKIEIKSKIPTFLDWEAAGPEEFKTFNWEVYFTNTLPQTMGNCDLRIVLPQGWNFHRITGSDPKFKKKQPKPPYVFKLVDGQATVSIKRSPMKYMERTGIEFAFKNEQKPTILILVGGLLGLLYLYLFRHLLQKRDEEKTIDSNENQKEK